MAWPPGHDGKGTPSYRHVHGIVSSDADYIHPPKSPSRTDYVNGGGDANKYDHLGAAITNAAANDDVAEDFATYPREYLQDKYGENFTPNDFHDILNPSLPVADFTPSPTHRELVQILRSRIQMRKAGRMDPGDRSGLMCGCG